MTTVLLVVMVAVVDGHVCSHLGHPNLGHLLSGTADKVQILQVILLLSWDT
jgi:hypothetical protein